MDKRSSYVCKAFLALTLVVSTPLCFPAAALGSSIDENYTAIHSILSRWNDNRKAIDYRGPYYVSYDWKKCSPCITDKELRDLHCLLDCSWDNGSFSFSVEQYRLLLPYAIASSCVPLIAWVLLRCPGIFEGWGAEALKDAKDRERVI